MNIIETRVKNINRLRTRIIQLELESMKIDEVSAQEADLLCTISEEGVMNPTEIANRSSIHRSTVSALTKKLGKNGYITKTKDELHKKKVRIKITDKGNRLLNHIQPMMENVSNMIDNSVNFENVDDFIETLEDIDLNLSNMIDNKIK